MISDAAVLRRKQYLALALRRVRPGSGSSRALLLSRSWKDPSMDLGVELQRLQSPFIIVGAVATWLYMPQRMTRDLVLLVLAADAQRLHAELTQAGCARVGTLSIGGTAWRTPPGGQLSVLESTEPWAADAVRDPDRTTGLPVIKLPYLVLMKLQASRAQDVADLSRMLGQADESALAEARRGACPSSRGSGGSGELDPARQAGTERGGVVTRP